MRYKPLNNQPNVSEMRLQSISPSLKMDSRPFPHVSYLSKKDGANIINYTYFDGLQWSYNGLPAVYKSKETIIYSPNSLILDTEENPVIAFSRRGALGSKHSLATINGNDGWDFNELDVNYETSWIGIIKITSNIDVSSSSSSSSSSSNGSRSSSSSSSSLDKPLYYVAVYDSTNEEIKIYSIASSWVLIGSTGITIDDVSTIKIDSCGNRMGIAFFDSDGIRYSFFDLNTQSWVNYFTSSPMSKLYGEITDMDFAGYHDSSNAVMAFGWLSSDSSNSYVCSVLIYDDLSEQPSDTVSAVVETNPINVVTSSNYLVNSYRNIGICVDNDSLPQMIVTGASSEIFYMSGTRVWLTDIINIEGVSDGIVPSSIRVAFKGDTDIVISLALDTGDIYYFEKTTGDTFDVSTPDMVILNDKWAYHTTYSVGELNGTAIQGAYNSYCGGVLGENKSPVVVTSNGSLITVPTTTTTTTLPIICCTNFIAGPFKIFDGTGSGCVLSNFVLNGVSTGNSENCKLYTYMIEFVGVPGAQVMLLKLSGGVTNWVAMGMETHTSAPQTILIYDLNSSGISGSCFWNGTQYKYAQDYEDGSYIKCP